MDNKNIFSDSSRRDFLKITAATFGGMGMVMAGIGKLSPVIFFDTCSFTENQPTPDPKTELLESLQEWNSNPDIRKDYHRWPVLTSLDILYSGELAEVLHDQVKPAFLDPPYYEMDFHWDAIEYPTGPEGFGGNSTVGHFLLPWGPNLGFDAGWRQKKPGVNLDMQKRKRWIGDQCYGFRFTKSGKTIIGSSYPVRTGKDTYTIWTYGTLAPESREEDDIIKKKIAKCYESLIDPQNQGEYDGYSTPIFNIQTQNKKAIQQHWSYRWIPKFIELTEYEKNANLVNAGMAVLIKLGIPPKTLEKCFLIEYWKEKESHDLCKNIPD